MAKSTKVTFDILKHIAVLSNKKDGWKKEANIVSWYGGPPKLDIREWDPTHERMTRGVTLWEEDATSLVDILKRNLPSEADFPKEGYDTSSGEISFRILSHLGTISRNDSREVPWTRECNIVSWHGGPSKVDIRDWDTETHERMTRGVKLTRDEALKLSEVKLKSSDFKAPTASKEVN